MDFVPSQYHLFFLKALKPTRELLQAKAIELPVAEATFFFDASLTLRKSPESFLRLILSPRPLSERENTPLSDNSVPEFGLLSSVCCSVTAVIFRFFTGEYGDDLHIPCLATGSNLKIKNDYPKNKIQWPDSQLKQERLQPSFVHECHALLSHPLVDQNGRACTRIQRSHTCIII